MVCLGHADESTLLSPDTELTICKGGTERTLTLSSMREQFWTRRWMEVDGVTAIPQMTIANPSERPRRWIRKTWQRSEWFLLNWVD